MPTPQAAQPSANACYLFTSTLPIVGPTMHSWTETYPTRSPRAARAGGESQDGHRSYAVRMRDLPLSPQEIRTAAAAYAELAPGYSAVVASSLERAGQG